MHFIHSQLWHGVWLIQRYLNDIIFINLNFLCLCTFSFSDENRQHHYDFDKKLAKFRQRVIASLAGSQLPVIGTHSEILFQKCQICLVVRTWFGS